MGTHQDLALTALEVFTYSKRTLSDAESPSPTPSPMPFQAKQDHT